MENIVVIGDRVLIRPEEAEEKTKVGLYLPQTVQARDEVRRGVIVKTGPGIPLADPTAMGEEPWTARGGEPRHLPMEAREGDYALFLRKASIEIQYQGETYLIVPQSALLLLIRETPDEPDIDLDDALGLDDDLDIR